MRAWAILVLLVITSTTLGDDPVVPPRPTLLPRPADQLVGRRVTASLEGLDVIRRDSAAKHASSGPARATVIAMRDVSCPLSRKYGPRLASLEDEYGPRGVRFVFVNASRTDSGEAMVAEIERLGLDGVYVHDSEGVLATRLRAATSTEVFVLDRAETLVYRGAVDDQYGIGYALPAPRARYLRDTLETLLAKRAVTTASTTAPGCLLGIPPAKEVAGVATYHGRISRLVRASCTTCHHRGGPGPFALESYQAVAGRGAMIRYVIDEGLMPPWHAGGDSGPWANDRSLSAEDRAALIGWIEAGCPEGEASEAPLAAATTNASRSGWLIGEPDAIVRLPKPIAVPAEGAIDYRYAWVKTDFGEDKWVSAIEFRPTAPQVVHHALMFLEAPRGQEESRRDYRRRWRGGLRGYFGGLVPGQGPTVFPEGVAKRIPAGSWIKFQMHYTPNGEAVTDQTDVAFRFADGPPPREMQTSSAATTRFRIPAGASNHEVRAEVSFPQDAVLYSFAPHMHWRGRSFRYELVDDTGGRELLLEVPRYDFNWQTAYKLLRPRRVAAGSRLVATAWYDNSEANPANPDPTVAVEFGEQTWDEMMIGYFEWWPASDDEP